MWQLEWHFEQKTFDVINDSMPEAAPGGTSLRG
jgi:hypothetical protein